MRRTSGSTLLKIFAFGFLTFSATAGYATDLESFEFDDNNFDQLNQAANTANPGNAWSTNTTLLTDSFVFNGQYRVAKFSDVFAPSYLQIDDVDPNTSGSRFIVVEVAGWDIRGFDPNDLTEPEEIRFGFIDEDTGTSGNTVVAQMQIARDDSIGSTGDIRLEGSALGSGASSISTPAIVNTVQTDPFTMVLELNKTSNTYDVFYKDGTNPSQALGYGSVDPNRDGNSIRFVVNNNFGTDLDENFTIERIAVTDVNPLTDLLTVEVNRGSGQVKLINTTGSVLSGLESYTLTSAIGALDPNGWMPITDNYDNASGPGDGSVDIDDDWQVDPNSNTSFLLEASLQNGGADGGELTVNEEVVLSDLDGLWIQNPIEDIQAEFSFAGGVTIEANVNYVGNSGKKFEVGDLNYDGSLTVDDWTIFVAGLELDLTGLSDAQAYQTGDLNYGGINSVVDFDIFKTAFEAANGLGSFELMLAGVPEPCALVLLTLGCLTFLPARARSREAKR